MLATRHAHKRATVRVPAQRQVNLYLPLPVIAAIHKYAKDNGTSVTLATTIAVDRFFRLPNRPKIESLGKCGATTSSGQKCGAYRMPGYIGCNLHEAESASVLVTFPLELQVEIDRFAADRKVSVNLVVAFAVQSTFGVFHS